MRQLADLLRGVAFVGLGNAWRALRYTRQKARWERTPAPSEAPVAVGVLLAVEPLPSGVRFRFANATLEVLFLSSDLLRLTWTPGAVPPPYALARTEWPEVGVVLGQEGETWRLRSAELALALAPDGLKVERVREGVVLRWEAFPQRRGEGWVHSADLHPAAPVFGLGEPAAPFNLRPGTYRLWNRDPGGAYGPGEDPLYLTAPVLWVHRPAPGYLIFYENPHEGQVVLGDRMKVAFEGGALRYYLIPGPVERALERFSELTGRPPLPPRWALGLHQSRWGYRTQAEVAGVLAGYRRHKIPLAAIHLDIDHMHGKRVFTSDPERFPDLAALAGQAHAQGVQVVTIVDPGVKRDPDYPVYRSGVARGVFCRLPDGREFHAPVWPGWCAFPDFTAPHARQWWAEQYAFLTERGVDGVWHDMNEPSTFVAQGDPTFPRRVQHHFEGQGGDHRVAHNLYGLLMNRAGFEGLRRLRPERRPWILSRSGWVGVQRYAWTWTADTESTWEALKMTVAQMLNLGLSGIPYSGPDIGGFSGAPDGELFTRWFQLAAFLPFFRIHSSIISPPREPWHFGEPYLSIVRAFARLRMRLMPYLYTLAWEASQRGWPLVRPLWWAHPEEADLWAVDDAFLLGEALLVAPVTEPGATTRRVRFPPGRWYDFWAGQVYEGGGLQPVAAPLERIPLFVRAGTILPLEDAGGEILELRLYPPHPGERAHGRLYLDAGDGYGPHRRETYAAEWVQGMWVPERQVEGDYPFPYADWRWTTVETASSKEASE